jgi:hypothetical protein
MASINVLNRLVLSNNRLNGTIPPALTATADSQLQILLLDNNRLTGPIPTFTSVRAGSRS